MITSVTAAAEHLEVDVETFVSIKTQNTQSFTVRNECMELDSHHTWKTGGRDD